MAAGASGTTTNFKIESKTTTAINNKPKRCKCREITISAANLSDSNPSPPSPPSHSTSSTPAEALSDPTPDPSFLRDISSDTSHADRKNIHSTTSYSTTRLQPPPSMEFSYSPSHGAVYDPVVRTLPSSFTKFNSALTAGLLNPMSPPPPQTLPIDKLEIHHRSSPTLFEMMTNEPECVPRTAVGSTLPTHQQNAAAVSSLRSAVVSAQDKQFLMRQRISQLLGGGDRSPGNLFNDALSGDIKLTLSDMDGFSVNLNVHREVLVGNSSFFGGRLSERWTKQQRSGPFEVEIADCEDVEIYVETLRLMYCKDLRRILMKEDVLKVLGILKISVAIGFDAGILSCLEYLEAAPWAEDEEERVASLLSELQLEGTAGAREVLKRISLDIMSPAREQLPHVRGIDMNEQVLMNLLIVVLEGKDERASREMKGLVSKMLKENQNHNDLRKESIYSACESCLQRLQKLLIEAAESDLCNVGQIAKEADNLHWLLDILIDRRISEEFLNSWANQSEMSNAHHKVAPVHRHEVSRVTARLFVGIGKGQLLAPKHLRCLLMKTWLVPFYEDFGWMRRASKGLDRHLIEDGLSNTILTLPLSWQQDILLAWFERFLNSGDDCPNIQRGFEVWWRRAFWRRTNGDIKQPCVRVASI